MAYLVDTTQLPVDILTNLINQENPGVNLKSSDYSIAVGYPKDTTLYGKDTATQIYGAKTATFSGRQTFYYNRINVNLWTNNKTLTVHLADYVYTTDLFPLILQQLGINLTERDVVRDYLQVDANGNCILTIARTSLMYKGYIVIKNGDAPKPRFTGMNTLLDGFYRPY